ncbi:hypothetical protein [Shewanella waksmanii]|uniref:hypothetical protein n=1 Tax=Shewanella waksmanii TaxID=213783 RepID=UPI003736BFEE
MAFKMMEPYVPQDQQLLANLGELILRAEHLNYMKTMLLKTLHEVSPKEAMEMSRKKGAAQLRKEVKKSSRELQCQQAITKINSFMERAETLTNERNQLTHGVWAQVEGSQPSIQVKDQGSQPIPSVAELRRISDAIDSLYKEINHERLHGCIKQAMENN